MISPVVSKSYLGICMGNLILNAILLHVVYASFSCFSQVVKSY